MVRWIVACEPELTKPNLRGWDQRVSQCASQRTEAHARANVSVFEVFPGSLIVVSERDAKWPDYGALTATNKLLAGSAFINAALRLPWHSANGLGFPVGRWQAEPEAGRSRAQTWLCGDPGREYLRGRRLLTQWRFWPTM